MNIHCNIIKIVADKIMVVGIVRTQARSICLIMCGSIPFFQPCSSTIVPATLEDITWVVETGSQKLEASPIVPAVTRAEEAA